MKLRKLYIAGPMSGYPQFNFPAFTEAAKALREANPSIEFVSPAEIDEAESSDYDTTINSTDGSLDELETSWSEFLLRDLKIVMEEVDGVVLLKGWAKSKGARLEAFTAVNMGKEVYLYDPNGITMMYALRPHDVTEMLSWYLITKPEAA